MPGVRAPFQLARTLEASVGPDRVLLETLQRPTLAQRQVRVTRRSDLEIGDLLEGVVRPLDYRLAILIVPFSPATEYQTHARVPTQ